MIKYLRVNFLPIHTTLSICFIGSVMLLFACTSLTPKPSSMDCTPVDTSAVQGKIVGTWQGLAMNTSDVDNKIVATGTWFFDASKGTWSGCR